jgi:peptide/nickel transport system permease protein
MVPMLIGISLVSFAVLHLAPGDPVDQAGAFMNAEVDPQAQARLREVYGLDRPLHVQFVDWLGRMARLDFGVSMSTDRRPVLDKVLEALPVTLGFNIISLLLVLAIAIPVGVHSAVRSGSRIDRLLTVVVFVGFSTPSFWLALMLMMLFGVQLGWLPVSWAGMPRWGEVGFGTWLAALVEHGVVPMFCMSFGALAGFSRYMRASMRDALGQDYVLAARSRGRSEWGSVWRHGFRNALLPLITLLGLSLPGLIGGSVILETVFAIPGMGRLFFDAVYGRDFTTIMGILTMGAVLTLVGNLLADVGYALADPRIRRQTEGSRA